MLAVKIASDPAAMSFLYFVVTVFTGIVIAVLATGK